MELKQGLNISAGFVDITFNRTNMELKHSFGKSDASCVALYRHRMYNTKNTELKFLFSPTKKSGRYFLLN